MAKKLAVYFFFLLPSSLLPSKSIRYIRYERSGRTSFGQQFAVNSQQSTVCSQQFAVNSLQSTVN
ncbi:MAG: hypothetical protein WBA89_19890 [Microcoleus sp.]|uniref:hypothetical protein n=1 Tax=Microcoleus sp. TaxID=44472 RepID=UPI003C77DEE0